MSCILGSGVLESSSANVKIVPTPSQEQFVAVDLTGMYFRESFPFASPVLRASSSETSVRGQFLSVADQRVAFVEKYAIKELGRSEVALTLPAGMTRSEFLSEAQALSIALHKQDSSIFLSTQVVWPDRLEDWQTADAFRRRIDQAHELKVDGRVEDSENKMRLEQKLKGWNDIALHDLASAHVAYYLLTGRDLFDGHTVRASDGVLSFSRDGLEIPYSCPDDARGPNISASRRIAV